MTFHRRAWHAAAEEYGRKRAEEYGRRAKIGAVLGWLLAGILLWAYILAAAGAFGG